LKSRGNYHASVSKTQHVNLSHTPQESLGLLTDLQYTKRWHRVLHNHFCNKNLHKMLLMLMHSCWKKNKAIFGREVVGFFSVKHSDFPDCSVLEQNSIRLSIQLNAGVADVWAEPWWVNSSTWYQQAGQ